MDQRPPTIQQGTAEGKKRINTKLAPTSLLPHCLSFPFFFKKCKKSLCHSRFRALRNALIQQRSARSSVMVNIYCRMHSYSILRASLACLLAQVVFASSTSSTFFKLTCAASQTLHSWSQFSFFPLLSPLPPLVPIQWGGRLSSVNLRATFWDDSGCDQGRAAPEAAR